VVSAVDPYGPCLGFLDRNCFASNTINTKLADFQTIISILFSIVYDMKPALQTPVVQ
jgi:hypothetical protein